MADPAAFRRPVPAFDSNKALPHNPDAERAILGAALLDNQALARAFAIVTPDDFFIPQNRYIARAMKALAQTGNTFDTVILHEYLTQHEQIDAAGGPGYLSQLADGVPQISNVESYAAIVRSKSMLRALIRTGEAMMSQGQAGDDPLTIAQLAQKSIESSILSASNGQPRRSFELLDFLKQDFPPPEEIIRGVIVHEGTALIVAMPHHLKSWFTLAIAIGCTVPGTLMGKLEVPKPVRTYLMTIEDFAGQVQWRTKQLLLTNTFRDYDPALVRVLPRGSGRFDIMNEADFQHLVRELIEFKADHVILDVLRRFFHGDINSPKESGALCEQFHRLQDRTGAAVTVVHHENRKQADIMQASAGSYNLPGWANSVIQFKRKMQRGKTSHVEIEVDNKLAQSAEPMRMTLDLTSEVALRMEAIEDAEGIIELRRRLQGEWTVRDLAEALDVHKSNAYRRLEKLVSSRQVEQVKPGKRGRIGGLARFYFIDEQSIPDDLPN